MEKYSFADDSFSAFRCPVCRKGVALHENVLRCESGHCFDLSREGYVNLLVGRNGGTHGDNKEMISARARFLSAGHYLPLRALLCARVKACAPEVILDAGCGEGWYTQGLSAALPDASICAVDVSKTAAAYCAKRLKGRAATAVASVYDLPLRDGGIDAVASVFSPFSREEFLRVLKPGGALFAAIPGEKHLWQLKELLYEEPYENEVRPKGIAGFEFCGEDELHYTRYIEGEELRDLFAMTPYYYRTPEEGRRRAEECGGMDVEIAFRLLAYRKKE